MTARDVKQGQIIFENEFAVLRYHPATKIVHHDFRRFVHGEQFRQVLERGLQLLQKHGACKWLSDDRGNGALLPEDSEWAVNEWGLRAMAAGWKYWAVIMPEKVIGQLNMRRWTKIYADRGVTVRAFTDPDEAMKWLESQR